MGKSALLIWLTVMQVFCYSQQPVIHVQSFEYFWQKSLSAESKGGQVNILSTDTIKEVVEKSFTKAIQQRWKTEIPPLKMTVKTFSLLSFSNAPKFSTKMKEKQPGSWYLFLQIFEDGATTLYNEDRSLATPLHVKCKLISDADSVVFERNLLVRMNKEKPMPDHVQLERLTAHPTHFIKAFDSIAVWLFDPGDISEKDVWLKQAYVYTERKLESVPIAQLLFENNDTIIRQVSEPTFFLHSTGPTYTTKAVHKNAGGNTVSGAVTLFTGVSINKVRAYEYAVDFLFKENDSTVYNCMISYAERASAGRDREKTVGTDGSKSYSLNAGSYTVVERRTNEDYLQVITKGMDTVATFTIGYQRGAKARNNYKQLWDGTDTTSIMPLPDGWNNKSEEDIIIVQGKAGDISFSLKSKDENTVKEFYFNDKLALVMYGKSKPSKAVLLEPVSPVTLRICTILAWLPYTHFNYSAE